MSYKSQDMTNQHILTIFIMANNSILKVSNMAELFCCLIFVENNKEKNIKNENPCTLNVNITFELFGNVVWITCNYLRVCIYIYLNGQNIIKF